jgi:hypothetical protein
MAHLSDGHLSNGGLSERLKSSAKFKKLTSLADDITVLKSIWFSKAKGEDHASRLEQFYAPQAQACKPILCNNPAAMLSGPLLVRASVGFWYLDKDRKNLSFFISCVFIVRSMWSAHDVSLSRSCALRDYPATC